MTRIAYIDKRFSRKSQTVIDHARQIIEEYEDQGFTLTLRQLYYQFVTRGLLVNKFAEYKRLGTIINDARLAGQISWESLEDRTRHVRQNSHWENPHDILKGARDSYAIDKWAGQPHRPEIWIEKDALLGVIEAVCQRLDVPFFSCRGYTSQSEQWRPVSKVAKLSRVAELTRASLAPAVVPRPLTTPTMPAVLSPGP